MNQSQGSSKDAASVPRKTLVAMGVGCLGSSKAETYEELSSPVPTHVHGVFHFVDSALVAICGDYKRPEKADPYEGQVRKIGRAVLVLAVMVVFVGMFCGLFLTADQHRTKRVFADRFTTDGSLRQVFSVSPQGQVEGFRTTVGDKVCKVTCPCRNSTLRWSNFTDFYTYPPPNSNASIPGQLMSPKTLYPGGAKEFCSQFSTNYITSIDPKTFALVCNNRAAFLLNKVKSSFVPTGGNCRRPPSQIGNATWAVGSSCYGSVQQIESNWLMADSVFNLTVANRIIDSWDAAAKLRKGLQLQDTLEQNTTAGTTLDAMATAFYTVILDHLFSGGNSTDAVPLPTGIDGSGNLTADSSLNLGMYLNWTSYFMDCAPDYCDMLLKKSAARLFYEVVLALGGFLAVTNFLVQQVLWPNLCFLLLNSVAPVSPITIDNVTASKLERVGREGKVVRGLTFAQGTFIQGRA